jgi:hypothetical protein
MGDMTIYIHLSTIVYMVFIYICIPLYSFLKLKVGVNEMSRLDLSEYTIDLIF